MRLLIQRQANGIGDWLFTLAAMKHLPPEVETFVDFVPKKQPMVPLIHQAFTASDVRFKLWTRNEVDRTIEHTIYPVERKAGGEPYIKGIVDQLGRTIGRPLTFNPRLLPQFTFERRPLGNYVCVVGGSKQAFKDWGRDHFQALADWIRAELRMEVVQVGSSSEPILRGARTEGMDAKFRSLAAIIHSARAVVCLENGISVIAGMLDRPQITIYMRGDPRRMDWPDQAKLWQPSLREVQAGLAGMLGKKVAA